MNISKTHNLYLTIFVFLILVSFSRAEAQTIPDIIYGASGWSMYQSEFRGFDSTTCGTQKTVGQIQLAEEDSNAPVEEPPAWSVSVINSDGFETYRWSTAAGITNISPKFCYRLLIDSIKVVTIKGAGYYGHSGQYSMAETSVVSDHGTESYLGRVHLRKLSRGINNFSPIYPGNSYHKYNPEYIINTNEISNLYNSTERYMIKHLVANTSGEVVTRRNISSSGSSGLEILPALNLPDGRYFWSFSTILNGNFSPLEGLEFINGLPASGASTPLPFTIDSTPPSSTVSLDVIGTSVDGVQLKISNTTQDTLSGTLSTTLFVRNTLSEGSWSYMTVALINGSNDEQTVVFDYTLPSGSIYEYYLTTTDLAGNTSTSTMETYSTLLDGSIVTRIVNPLVVDTTADYSIEHDISNNINFDATALNGTEFLNPDNAAWEWRMDNCTTGQIYSAQKMFSTSTVNNLIIPDGNPRTIYLRARDTSVSPPRPWSNNCPSVNITINCTEDETWNGSSCSPIVATYPDLISRNLAISAGPYRKNNTIVMTAEIANVGDENTIFMTTNRFSYSWDNDTWINISPSIFHGSIPAGDSRSVESEFTLPQTGNLFIRFCVDTNNSIDEGPLGESPNCTRVGPFEVTDFPEAQLSGNGCTISNSGTDSSCNGLLSWSFNNTSYPSIYNLTTNTTYSNNNSGNNFITSLNYGPNIIQAREMDMNNLPIVLKQITLNTSCDPEQSFWDGVQCGPLPNIDISAIPATVRAGQPTSIKIGINSDYTFNCQLLGADTYTSDLSHTGGPDVQYYEFPTRKLYSAQIIQISCDVMGNSVKIDTRIDIIGKPYEV